MPVGPSILWPENDVEVGADRGQVERQMRHRLGAVEQHQGARPMRALATISATGLMVPSTFETWATATTRVRGDRSRSKASRSRIAVADHRDRAQHRAPVAADHLPRDQVRVVLQLA